MRLKTLLTGWMVILSLPSFAQQASSFQSLSGDEFPEKKTFVYKTVSGHEIKANVFLPGSNELHPVVIFFHGGFFFGNRDQGLSNSLKDKLVSSGYAVVSADYRLAPETKLKGILEDVNDINKWMRKQGLQELNIDTAKIAVAGCSAGGYMAFTSGFNPKNAPDAIIAISSPTGFSALVTPMGDLSVLNKSGPYDVVSDSVISYGDYTTRVTLWRFLAENRLALYELFGFDPATEPEKLDAYTLTNNITSDFPPTLLIHARNDYLVDLQQVQDCNTFLTGKKIKTELFLVENGHGNQLLDQNPEAVDKIIMFLNAVFRK